ncbi:MULTISPECIES: hypothetical protein [Bacillus]|uniref:hypothetical protein n=1 Tax=Bacillus TaxID=1386 RepID=UPI0003D79DE4|nr:MULTISPECIES: hypothetical protein [Bacillus]MCM3355391.1 hypothetical protein [Bacillus halotolerans]PAY15141.1 hypothetical protein CJU60_00100 [Bacillus sp. 7705b]
MLDIGIARDVFFWYVRLFTLYPAVRFFMLSVCLRIFGYKEEKIEVIYKYCAAALQVKQDMVCCFGNGGIINMLGTPNGVYDKIGITE